MRLRDRLISTLGCLGNLALGVYLWRGGQLRRPGAGMVGGSPADRAFGGGLVVLMLVALVVVWWPGRRPRA